MVAKRFSGASPTKCAKAPRRTPLGEEWKPAEELLLASSPGLPTTCVEMLRWALPHALCTPKDERHSFQESVIGAVALLHAKEEGRRSAAVGALEVEAMVLAASVEQAAKVHEVSQAEEVETREAKRAKAEEIELAKKSLEATNSQVEEDRTKLSDVEAQVKTATESRSQYEQQVTSCWPMLKDVTFDKRDWRGRNKAIETIVECLGKGQAEGSLMAALPPSLKVASPEVRDEFARRAVEHAEAALHNQIAKMSQGIQQLQEKVGEQGAVVYRSGERVKEAQALVDAALQATIDAEKAWLKAETRTTDLQKTASSVAVGQRELSSKVDAEKAALASFQDLVAKFNALVDGTSRAN